MFPKIKLMGSTLLELWTFIHRMKEKHNNLDLGLSHLLSLVLRTHLDLVVCVFLRFLMTMVQRPSRIIRMLLRTGRSRMIDLLPEICLDVLLHLLNSMKDPKNDIPPDPMKVLNESTIHLLMAITPLPNHLADRHDRSHLGHGLHPHLNLIRIINNTPTLHHSIHIITPLCDLLNLLRWVSLVIHLHHILAI
jgi:hypothetical protein